MNETGGKRKTKIRPARTVGCLIIAAAVVCAVIWGGRAIIGFIWDEGADDTDDSASEYIRNELGIGYAFNDGE
jgi:hypothetical protein